jgi:uncharacterized protein (TIGR02145 family)
MKKLLFLLMIAAAVAGCKKDDEAESVNTPPLAASTQTSTFSDQTWSDAIHCPECNKETFEDSDTDPQCRSYTEDGKTWYYYNWAYVDANKATMCPDPWRVPTREEFNNFVSNTTYSMVTDAWGYGGGVVRDGNASGVSSAFGYWSATKQSDYNSDYAWNVRFEDGHQILEYIRRSIGLQVRCVQDK